MQVITRLKRKMVITVLCIEAVVFALILGALNVVVYRSSIAQTERNLFTFAKYDIPVLQARMAAPETVVPPRFFDNSSVFDANPGTQNQNENFRELIDGILSPGDEHRRMQRNCFALLFNREASSVSVLTNFPLRYTEEEIEVLVVGAGRAAETGNPRYLLNSTGAFLYIKQLTENGFIVMVSDFTKDLQTSGRLLLLTGIVYLLAVAVSAVAAYILAEHSVRPVRNAFETQKQFVADAGHELKTPVAVIGANADALAGEIGNNKWLTYIKTETDRMASLVTDLLYLAKNDAGRTPWTVAEFNLSRAVEAAVLPFESILYEQHKMLHLEIPDSVYYTGDERRITQIVVILLDNAVKNSPEGAVVSITLGEEYVRKHSRFRSVRTTQPYIRVYNEGEGLDATEMKKVFQRFYRTDTSRARETGGSGLGLSIAETIASAHQGSITVEGEKGRWIAFTVHLGRVSGGMVT